MLSRLLLGLCLLFHPMVYFTQGLEGIIVERYYLSDGNDAADAMNNGSVTALPAGSVTYRVFVDMAADYKFSQIFGNGAHNLTVNTSTDFYNDPSYGVIINPGTISASNIRKHTAMIDSWFTTGGASNGKVGVLKSEDSDGSVGNQHNVLQNNPGGCYGLPINGSGAQDGLTPNSSTTYLVPNALGLGNALDALDQTAGNSVVISNGAIAALGGIVGPTASNRVLIAQFTTSGVLSFSLNVQLVNVLTGGVENYVANDPSANELTHPTLSYNSNTAPTIQLTSPTSGATIGLGNYMLTANASDNLGSLASVEFFVDGLSVGVDNVAPYEVSYNATPGSHQVYAVARDYDCLTAQTSNITFSVSNNQAPVVSLSGPTSAVEGSSITFTAAASDADGTITSVQFYVDGVSIGSDNSAPYSTTWNAVLGANQQVTAMATDNTGLSTTSNVIVISVATNVPPTINITYPFSTTDVTAPELVPLTAEAADSDGFITQVSFYVNGLLVGTASSAPYIYNWLSQAGPAEITAVATDSNGAQTTSNSVNIVVLDPSTQPYAVGSVTQACNLTTYCIPIQVSAAFPVNGVIGYDITMTYNANQLQPTGNAELTSQLINSSFASVNVVSTVPGQAQVQITLNGNAPGGTSFNGYGTLGCIEFNRLPGFGPEDSSFVNISSLIESYVTGPIPVAANAAYIYSEANTVLNGTVDYGSSGAALVSGDFGTVSQTDVFGITTGQISNPLNPAVIDNQGGFSHDLTSGTEIYFNRDIPNEVSVQSFINGGDVLVAKSLLNNSEPLTIWQMLALDVNMDGFITAGDISQMNQRATLMIGEYQQAWNYDNQGNSNGQPSKDWVFIDSNRLGTPAYQISSTFPNDDQIGFSALRVPLIPFTLPTLATDFNPASATCQSWADEVFHAVLLGDADGNYMSTEEYASDSVVFDISQAVYSSVAGSNFIEIPVISDFINGDIKSLDIATKFNLNKLVFVEANSSNPDLDVVSYFNSADAFIRIVATTNSNSPFALSSEILKMKFEVISDCAAVTSQDFNSTQNWLNGSVGSLSFLDGSTLPEPIQVLAPAPYCAGSPIEMTYGNQIEGLDIVTYAWSFGDGSTASGQTVSPSITAVGDVSIVLSLTVGNGCVYEVPGSLFLNTSPQASFTYSIDAGQTVTFNNTSTIAAGSIASNAWDFGDGQNAADASPIHTYAAGGSYTVTLTIASALGCESSYSQSINTVGVNELEQINLSVYPNPAVDQFTVTFNHPIQLDILDVNGRVVCTNVGILWSSPSTVWVGDLSSGLYVIRAIQGSSMVTKNIVIE